MNERVRKNVLYLDDLDDDMPTLPRIMTARQRVALPPTPALPVQTPTLEEIRRTWKLREAQIILYLKKKLQG